MNDISEDIKNLYDQLKNNKLATAKLTHIHLRKIHELSPEEIRKKLTTFGLSKVVEISLDEVRETT